MKKIGFILLLMFALTLSACGAESPAEAPAPEAPAAEAPAAEAVSDWRPDGQIELVVPFSAGGSSDLSARALAPYLEKVLDCSIYINNMPGAGGLTGTAYALDKAADGYTYVWLGTRAVSPELYQTAAPYSTEDLALIAEVSETYSVLAVPGDSEFNTVEELLDYCKENPGQKYAHTGRGYKNHLTALLINDTYDLGMIEVPYSGDSEACTAILRGEVACGFISLTSAKEQDEAGNLKILAILNSERSDKAPDIPTIGETKYAVTDLVSYIALCCDADVDQEIVDSMSRAVAACFEQYPELADNLDSIGQKASYRDSEELTVLNDELSTVIGPLWKDAGLYE